MTRRIPFEWHGEGWEALASRGLWHPASRTLLVADLHLGKGEHFRRMALPVPPGSSARTLERLSETVAEVPCERLWILGDLWHSARGVQGSALEDLSAWARNHRAITLGLVRGNHDRTIQHPDVPDVPEPFLGPVRLCHHPDPESEMPHIGGHLHPAVRLSGRGRASLSVPCFWFGHSHGVLPAFGEFTGTSLVRPAPEDRVFVVAGESLLEPTRRAAG